MWRLSIHLPLGQNGIHSTRWPQGSIAEVAELRAWPHTPGESPAHLGSEQRCPGGWMGTAVTWGFTAGGKLFPKSSEGRTSGVWL